MAAARMAKARTAAGQASIWASDTPGLSFQERCTLRQMEIDREFAAEAAEPRMEIDRTSPLYTIPCTAGLELPYRLGDGWLVEQLDRIHGGDNSDYVYYFLPDGHPEWERKYGISANCTKGDS